MKRNPLFSALPGQAIDHLASHACLQHFDSGQILIEENGDNNALFLLTKGTVSIIINATEVGTQQAGETVGEISMSKISPPVARVMATEGVEAVSFPFEIIDACCADHPDFAMRLRATGLQKVYGR
ncbi:MAG: cyclic nucleotide-binding domain-containing protein [Mariprofundus sp.]